MTAATHTIQLSAATYDQLVAVAKKQQIEIESLIKQWLASLEKPQQPNKTFAYLASIAEDFGIDDLAENHDHYLYGTEKR